MAKTLYVIALSLEERCFLNKIIDEGKASPKTIMRSKILLLSDRNSNEKKYSKYELAQILGTTHATVQSTRTDYAKGGIEYCIYKKNNGSTKKMNLEVEQQIILMVKENPPVGKKRWSLRLICSECVRREIVPSVTATTIKKILDNNNITI